MARLASDKTKLRNATSRLNARIKYQESLIDELRERRRIGSMLANVAFNLALRKDVEPELKSVLDECRKAWDEIRSTPL